MKQSITIKLNVWIICAVLVLTNLITIGLWQPWANNSGNRKITVTGSTTIQSEPDQYVFSPYYQKQGTDKSALNTELGELSKTIVASIKELGVKDSAIKTDAYSYDYGRYYSQPENSTITATLNLTVTLNDKVLAQKVQDYLASTDSSGSITPQITFSTAKQKTLETQARQEAIADAKSKAGASAKQLETSLGKVIDVSDLASGGITPMPWMLDSSIRSSDITAETSDNSSSYTIQPGLNEYSFSVNVTYELK